MYTKCTLHPLTFQLAMEIWTACLAVNDGGGQLDDLCTYRQQQLQVLLKVLPHCLNL